MTETAKEAYEAFKTRLDSHATRSKMSIGSQHLHTGYIVADYGEVCFHATRNEELKVWFLHSPEQPVQADKHFSHQNSLWDDFRSVSKDVPSAELADQIFDDFVQFIGNRAQSETSKNPSMSESVVDKYRECDPW